MSEGFTWADVQTLRDSQDADVLRDVVLRAERVDIEGEELREETCHALIAAALKLREAPQPDLPPPFLITPQTLVPEAPEAAVWAAVRRFCSMCRPASLVELLPFLRSADIKEIQVACQGLANILEVDRACPIPPSVREAVALLSERSWADNPVEGAAHAAVFVAAKLLGFEPPHPKILFKDQRKLLGLPTNCLPWEW